MKAAKKFFWGIAVWLLLACVPAVAQTVLIDYNFQALPYPAGVTTNGTINTTKAADGVCSKGMVQVNAGQFFQVDVPTCGEMILNMKSTSSSARNVVITARKRGEVTYTNLGNISVLAAATFNLTSLFPGLVYNDSISMRLEAGGNIQIHDLLVKASATVSNQADILVFKLSGQLGNEVINSGAGTVHLNIPMGTPLTSVVPAQVQLSPQATINPLATAARNFSGGAAVPYTVTAQDGTQKNWMVTVSEVASSAKQILSFTLVPGQIGPATIDHNAGTVQVLVPLGTALGAVTPVSVTLSPYATLLPDASVARDFTAPVAYTVRAQDLSEKVYNVTATAVDPNDLFTTYEAEQAEFTGKTDNQHAGYTGTGFVDFLSSGENYILFTVCQQQAGNRLLRFRYALGKIEDRTAQLYVNDVAQGSVAFPPTATFTDWTLATMAVSLPAGVSRIKLAWPGTDGPNLDNLSLNGAACNTWAVQASATGGGSIVLSPQRSGNLYFEGETVTATAVGNTGTTFVQWGGDTTATTNPLVFEVRKARQLVAQFTSVPVFTLTVQVNGIGKVVSLPTGNTFALGTPVQLQAQTLLGSTFLGWSGNATGTNATINITMDANKTVTASFSSPFNPDFNKVVGFASVAGDGFAGPVTGGAAGTDTLIIQGPAEFNKLCEAMYYRGRAYKNNTTTNGYKKAPLVVILKSGVYDGTQALSADGAKAFANAMLDIPEQGDISFLGDCNVIFKIGINVKRSWNVLIRNISFYDYDDDAINVGYPETHHVWIDHCTFGHPLALPANKEVPDGTSEVKDGASFVTISWCKYQNHWKTSLVGHSDNNGATDSSRLKVTYYANYFVNTNSRNPRVRFGQVHVLNNLYENSGLGRQGQLGYGIAASNNSQVYAEGNFFIDTRWPMLADRAPAAWTAVYGTGLESPTGNKPCFGLVSVNNEYDDAGLTQSLTGKVKAEMLNPGNMSIRFDTLTTPQFTFNPADAYSYEAALLPASAVRVLIPLHAGADVLSSGSCILPVQLTSFTGANTAGGNLLNWTTTNEQNLAGYEVQRSADGKNFARIGTVVAANNIGLQQYSWLDKRAAAGANFYRLAMADKDGSRTYSHIVKLQHALAGLLTIAGDPSLRSLMIQLPEGAGKPGELVVYSADGKAIARLPVATANRWVQLNMTGKPAGKYWVLWQQGGQRLHGSFVIW